WTPLDRLSIKLSALYQSYRRDGSDEATPANPNAPQTAGLAGLTQSYIYNSGWADRKFQAYSLALKGKLGNIDLTSLTGYNITHDLNSVDFGFAYSPIVNTGVPDTAFNGFGGVGAALLANWQVKRISQEVRLATAITEKLEVLAGGYYTYEN